MRGSQGLERARSVVATVESQAHRRPLIAGIQYLLPGVWMVGTHPLDPPVGVCISRCRVACDCLIELFTPAHGVAQHSIHHASQTGCQTRASAHRLVNNRMRMLGTSSQAVERHQQDRVKFGRQGFVQQLVQHQIATAVVAQTTGTHISHRTPDLIRPSQEAGLLFEGIGKAIPFHHLGHQLGRLQKGVCKACYLKLGAYARRPLWFKLRHVHSSTCIFECDRGNTTIPE